MSEEDRIDLSSVPREIAPPRGLDRQIAAELKRRGLLRRRRIAPYAAAAVVAAALIAVALMYRPAPSPSPHYILFLYETPQFSGGNRAEYGQWARSMRPYIAGGEELAGNDVLAMSGATTPLPGAVPRLAGYFLIDARDDTTATRIARACPHLRHGGAVVLRKIVD